MDSRGEGNDPRGPSLTEMLLRQFAMLAHTMNRADDYARERLGIEPPRPKRKLLELKEDGTFIYNDTHVTFKNPNTLPHLVLMAIYKQQDPSLGYAPYQRINRWIEAMGVEKSDNDQKIVKRIRNAIENIPRSSDLRNTTPTGDRLIEVIDGKGIALRNPEIT